MRRGRGIGVGIAMALVSGLGLYAASPASAEVLDVGTVDDASTDYGSGYPIGDCEWLEFGPGPLGNTVAFTPSASGTATFSLSVTSWDVGAVVAIFDGSYGVDTCLASSLTYAPDLPSVTLPVTGGQDYVVMVWGCSGSCDGLENSFGTYTLEVAVAAGSAPDRTPWLQAYARTSADAACETGWSPSWAQWPNDGGGGWVCERETLAYGS